MDADVGRARLDDDRSGSWTVLWRHGAQVERRRHRDDQLCRHLPDHAGADCGSFGRANEILGMLWFIGLWAIFVYAPVAHWVWGPDGIFNAGNDAAWAKVLDFAGGTVVHINAGVAGLMCAIMLGKRSETGPAHNMVLTFIGASLLWVGWFGFNAGSAVSTGMQAGMAMLVTQIATAV